jgi:YD repeat-containing protein
MRPMDRWRPVVLAMVGGAMVALLLAVGVSASDLLGGGSAVAAPSLKTTASTATHSVAGRKGRSLRQLTAGAQLVSSASTPFSRTYRRADGSALTRVFSRTVNFRDRRGRWHAIDNTLRRSGSMLRNAAGPFALRIPSSFSSGAVELHAHHGSVGLSLRGARGTATAHGASAIYRQALPGTDVTYTAGAQSVEELLTLHRGAPTTFTYELTTSGGLAAHLTPTGAVELRDRANHVRFAVAPAVAWPSDRPDERAALTTRLARTGKGWTLRQTVDARWLERELAHGTVTVDPTIEIDPDLQDCFIESDTPTTNYCSQNIMSVGYDGANDQRAMVQFDLSALPRSAVILNADLGLTGEYHSTSALKQVGLYQLLRPWTNSTTWNRYDSTHAWGSPGAAASTDAAATPAAVLTLGNSTGFVDFYPTNLVQAWVNGSTPNYGVLIRDVTPNTTANEINFSTREFGGVTPELDILWAPRTGAAPDYTFTSMRLSDGSDVGVNVANGNLLMRRADLVEAGSTMAWELRRSYNSALSDEPGQAGFGWSTSPGSDTRLDPLPDGSLAFHAGDGMTLPFLREADGSFITPDQLDDMALSTNADGTRTLVDPADGETVVYSAAGRLVKRQDASGHEMTFAYDGTGALQSIRDADGQTYEVDSAPGDPYVAKVTAPDGRYWTYTYGGPTDDELTSFRDASGAVTHYQYSTSGLLTTIQEPEGSVVTIEYRPDGRVSSVTRVAAGGAQSHFGFTYDQPAPASCNGVTGELHETTVGATVVAFPNGDADTFCYDNADDVLVHSVVPRTASDSCSGAYVEGGNDEPDDAGCAGDTAGVDEMDLSINGSPPGFAPQQTGPEGPANCRLRFNPPEVQERLDAVTQNHYGDGRADSECFGDLRDIERSAKLCVQRFIHLPTDPGWYNVGRCRTISAASGFGILHLHARGGCQGTAAWRMYGRLTARRLDYVARSRGYSRTSVLDCPPG